MSCETAVRVSQLSKCYQIYQHPSDRLRQLLWGKRRQYYREFWAVRDLSFDVMRGEVIGILGKNGSGKSTLLQMICGCVSPTQGEIVTQGRLAALLELGSGFNPEFNGLENVYFNASILGLSKVEINTRLDEILAFADIGDFIHQPVKTYSSGMAMRLAFAVAACVDPDILIVDEALAVGDVQFQSRCFRRFKTLLDQGTTIILVTHSTEQVVRHCSRALLMHQGRLIESGAPCTIANLYLDHLLGIQNNTSDAAVPQTPNTPTVASSVISSSSKDMAELLSIPFEKQIGYNPAEYRWGNRLALIRTFHLTTADKEGHHTHFTSGDRLSATLVIDFLQACERPIVGMNIKTPDGVTVYGNNTRECNTKTQLAALSTGAMLIITLDCTLWLTQGDYLLSFGIAADEQGEIVPLDRRYDAVHIYLSNPHNSGGLAELGMNYTVTSFINQLTRKVQ